MVRAAIVLCSIACALMPAIGSAADRETVALIGTGDMGDSLGPRLASLGYHVVSGTRR